MVTRQSIVYVSNNTIEPWLQKSIVRAVRGVLRRAPAKPLREPAMRDVMKEERPRLAGEWEFDDGERVVIDAEDTSLFATRKGIRYRVFPVSGRWFYIPGLDWVFGVEDSTTDEFQRIYRSANDVEARASRSQSASNSSGPITCIAPALDEFRNVVDAVSAVVALLAARPQERIACRCARSDELIRRYSTGSQDPSKCTFFSSPFSCFSTER